MVDRPESHGFQTAARWWPFVVFGLVLGGLYWHSFREMVKVWRLADSYYSHGFLVPLISGWVIWQRKREYGAAASESSPLGYAWLVPGLVLFLAGSFLSFRVFSQLSLLPVLAGLCMLLQGPSRTRLMLFPIAYLIFMIPIPPSLTQSIALQLKLAATQCSVALCNLAMLPLVRKGSTVYWITPGGAEDSLLVGEVCGGLRSLIALLAFGALAAWLSRTRPWARIVILAMSGPIAILSNIVRIFMLCVVGYFWGSEVAAGKFHDISGYLIFVVAFILFFALENRLRRIAPRSESKEEPAADLPVKDSRIQTGGMIRRHGIVAMVLLLAAGAAHFTVLAKQASAGDKPMPETMATIPARIADYEQIGEDAEVDEATARALETSTVLMRNYVGDAHWPVQLTIVFAGATRRSLHFPEVCLVGEGWDIREQTTTPVGFLFSGKRLVLVNGPQQQAVLYWFKTGDKLTGNYFMNAFQWAWNQLTFRTPTSAMIKLTTMIGPMGEEPAFAILEDFAVKFHPKLMEHIP